MFLYFGDPFLNGLVKLFLKKINIRKVYDDLSHILIFLCFFQYDLTAWKRVE